MYVARNPKDAIVSFCYHHKLIKTHDYKGDLEEFANYFMDDEGKNPRASNFILQYLFM